MSVTTRLQRLEREHHQREHGPAPLWIVLGGAPTPADTATVERAIRANALSPIVVWREGDTAAAVLARLGTQGRPGGRL